MNPIYPILIISLLTGAAAAQLQPDRERFDIEIHPGEVEYKSIDLTNVGDDLITAVTISAVGGSGRDLIKVEVPEMDELEPGDDVSLDVYLVVPKETEPGDYTGFFYIFDDAQPSVPIVIDFNIAVTEVDSYGVSLTIDGARLASGSAGQDESAYFELEIKNTGKFRDVISLDVPAVPEGWDLTFEDGDDEVYLPYEVSLSPGSSRRLDLTIDTSEGAVSSSLEITASSLGNPVKNSTVTAYVDVGVTVRGYDVYIEMPRKMVVNRSYTGTITILLEKDERIQVDMISDPGLLIVPSTLYVPVTANDPVTSNFTVMASSPGDYALLVNMMDSEGIPLPPEIVVVRASEPSGLAVVTGSDVRYTTMASLVPSDGFAVPVVSISGEVLGREERESLLSYADVLILGNESVVPIELERDLSLDFNVTRIGGRDLCETSWIFASRMWTNGTEYVVVTGPDEVNVLMAYQIAKAKGAPLIICGGTISEDLSPVIAGMVEKGLSRALLAGGITENATRALEAFGIETEAA